MLSVGRFKIKRFRQVQLVVVASVFLHVRCGRRTCVRPKASYMSGYYRVRDVDCAQCRVRLGVTYVGAVDPENHYKIGTCLVSIVFPDELIVYVNPLQYVGGQFDVKLDRKTISEMFRASTLRDDNNSFREASSYWVKISYLRRRDGLSQRTKPPCVMSFWCCFKVS